MGKLKNLNDLLEHQIKDLYSAENQLLDAYPNIINSVSDDKLKRTFETHYNETKEQKRRLENIADELNISPEGETCEAMKGLVRETTGMIDEDATEEVMDAGLLADAQRVEHYEISGYGTAISYADRLGYNKIVRLLTESFREEKNADETLTQIAQEKINQKAVASN